MRKLDRLNELLASPALDLPKHRRSVDSSGNNLTWLAKHIHARNTVTPELSELLGTPIQCLVKHEEEASV